MTKCQMLGSGFNSDNFSRNFITCAISSTEASGIHSRSLCGGECNSRFSFYIFYLFILFYFFCFLSILLYTDQFFYNDYLDTRVLSKMEYIS